MKSTWCYILLFLLAYLPIHAQESEKRLLWEVELQGALTNCSSWEVEPAVTFFPFKYAGISMGLLFTAPYPSTSENGITADRQLQWSSTHSNAASYLLAWRPALRLNTPKLWLGHDKEYALFLSVSPGRQLQWSSTHSNAASYLLAWRPALRLNTPKLWLGHDKEYALFLSVSPGLTLPFLADRQFSIDYYPNRTGVWTALKREQVKNSGARKVYYHLRTAISLEIDNRLIFSAGYTISDFDIYGGSRNIIVEGTKLDLPQPRNMHAAFLGIGIRF